MAAIAACVRWTTVPVCATAFVVVATRQHALLMLYHDAVHGLLARDRRLNDAAINLFVGVPFLLPVEVFRPLHIRHHRHLGQADDPERTILFADQHWRYRALPAATLLRQVLADLFLLNGVRTLLAWRARTPRLRVSTDTWMVALAWAVLLCTLLAHSAGIVALALALWFGPVLTLTNLLQKVRSFSEHGGGNDATGPGHEWTYSWRPGPLGRLFIWPYNINRHREHHAQPDVPWHGLPHVSGAREGELAGDRLGRLLLARGADSGR